jgi:hypothetical protein
MTKVSSEPPKTTLAKSVKPDDKPTRRPSDREIQDLRRLAAAQAKGQSDQL